MEFEKIKDGQKVVAGSMRNPALGFTGKVTNRETLSNGAWVTVTDKDGKTLRTRPSLVERA
jgi:hypothetical protein